MTRYSADSEVASKSEAVLERETAKKWAARALACYRRGWLLRAESYRHEALEHAALAGDHGKLVGELQSQIDRVRQAKTKTRKQARTQARSKARSR